MEHPNFPMMNGYGCFFGALKRSTKLRPLVSEFAAFYNIIKHAQHGDHSTAVWQRRPKAPNCHPADVEVG